MNELEKIRRTHPRALMEDLFETHAINVELEDEALAIFKKLYPTLKDREIYSLYMYVKSLKQQELDVRRQLTMVLWEIDDLTGRSMRKFVS